MRSSRRGTGKAERGSSLLTGILLLLVAALSTLQVKAWLEGREVVEAIPRAVAPREDLEPSEKKTIERFNAAAPSVVFITSIQLQRNYFSMDVSKIPAGTGSGFIWDRAGHVVTNYHVIRNAQEAEVTLGDHTTWKAKLVGAEPDKDLAVLKIDAPAEKLEPMVVGSSGDLQVGQSVLAIGNPFGLDQTLTTGVISGLGREIESVTRRPIQGVIQTDAAINPGNSGGPLLDSAGRLIGMNTAIFSTSGASAGIGFAVPVDPLRWMVPQIIEHGRVIKPGLGVTVAEDYVNRRLRLDGVLVVNVVAGGSAEKAGIRPTRRGSDGQVVLGDVIVAIDGEAVDDSDELFRKLDNRKVGEKVGVTVVRGEEKVEVEVTLQALSD